jgi:hypothetical protein
MEGTSRAEIKAKRRYSSTRLHGVTSQEISALRSHQVGVKLKSNKGLCFVVCISPFSSTANNFGPCLLLLLSGELAINRDPHAAPSWTASSDAGLTPHVPASIAARPQYKRSFYCGRQSLQLCFIFNSLSLTIITISLRRPRALTAHKPHLGGPGFSLKLPFPSSAANGSCVPARVPYRMLLLVTGIALLCFSWGCGFESADRMDRMSTLLQATLAHNL